MKQASIDPAGKGLHAHSRKSSFRRKPESRAGMPANQGLHFALDPGLRRGDGTTDVSKTFIRRSNNRPAETVSCPSPGELLITRRNLPHWQIGGSTYFITFRAIALTLPSPARRLVLDACLHVDEQRYILWAAVVMPDPVHLLIRPNEIEARRWWPLASILNSIKGFTAHQVNGLAGRHGPVWQDERFDRIVRDAAEFIEK